MKKIFLLFLFPLSVFSQYTSIPDTNFEQSLINYGYDLVKDGFVETSAIDTVTDLTINNNNISDLTGIESFIALQSLFCYDNNLSTLNLVNNTQLFEVTCSNNNLTSIDLRNGNNSGLWYFMSINNPSLNCIDVDDVAYCEYNFAVDSWTSFSNNCFPTNISGVTNNKKLIRVIDIHGRTIDPKLNTPLIYIFSDGSREKRVFIQ
ncbi:MAG: hypothetical protein CMP60_04265 [Flavobacteriales bacterium]|nr:hypothetical protein [Flavobacteriales bacterium]|tara:strand:- start:294 stop:908 length:615 start_codon:yes stop_codon:yes gene_type:complete